MLSVFKHELSMLFHNILTYVFGALFLLFVGIDMWLVNITGLSADLSTVLGLLAFGLVFIVPFLTMKSISEERKQKTYQLLYSLPISTTSVVIGKFLALVVAYMMPMAVIAFYPLVLSQYGDVYLPLTYGIYVALIFLGLAVLSVGMLASSITESQALAALIGLGVLLFNYFSSYLASLISSSLLGSIVGLIVVALLVGLLLKYITKSNYIAIAFIALCAIAIALVGVFASSSIEGLLTLIMEKLSLFDKFNVFVNGVFDITGIVFFLSVTVFCLFLCVQSLEKRRYN